MRPGPGEIIAEGQTALLRRQMLRQCLSALPMVPLGAAPIMDPAALIIEAEQFVTTAVERSAMLQQYWGPDELNDALRHVLTYVQQQQPRVRSGLGLIDQIAAVLARALVAAEVEVQRVGAGHVQ